jgi:hypothetical protein
MGQYCPYCNQPVENCICDEGVNEDEDKAPEPPRYDEPPPMQTGGHDATPAASAG